MLHILIINSGSISIKIRVFDDKQSIPKETIGHDSGKAEAYQILKDIGSASAVLIRHRDAIILTDQKI